jgi:hypothetical protein
LSTPKQASASGRHLDLGKCLGFQKWKHGNLNADKNVLRNQGKCVCINFVLLKRLERLPENIYLIL